MHLEVEVRAGRVAGHADVADDVTGCHDPVVALVVREVRVVVRVSVDAGQPRAVPAGAAVVVTHDSGDHRDDGRIGERRHVDALVHVPPDRGSPKSSVNTTNPSTGHRVAPVAMSDPTPASLVVGHELHLVVRRARDREPLLEEILEWRQAVDRLLERGLLRSELVLVRLDLAAPWS